MNSDDPSPSSPLPGPPLDPSLEARIVACVLGEASAAEASEIEFLCAVRPELADFRRRIAEVHGLLAETARPAPADFRLSAERRAKLLSDLSAAPTAASPVVTAFPPSRRWPEWAMPAAACLALLGLLAAVVIPTVDTAFSSAFSDKTVVWTPAKTTTTTPARPSFEDYVESRLSETTLPRSGPITAQERRSAEEYLGREYAKKYPQSAEVYFSMDATRAPVAAPAAASAPVPASPPPPPATAAPRPSVMPALRRDEERSNNESARSRYRAEALAEPAADSTIVVSAGELTLGDRPIIGDQLLGKAALAKQLEDRKSDVSGSVGGRIGVENDGSLRFGGGTIAGATDNFSVQTETTYGVAASASEFAKNGETQARWRELKDTGGVSSDKLAAAISSPSKPQVLDESGLTLGGLAAAPQPASPAVASGLVAENKPLDGLKAQARDAYARGDLDQAQVSFRAAQTVSGDSDAETNYFLGRIAGEKAKEAADKRQANREAMIQEVAKSWQRPGVSVQNESKPNAELAPVASAGPVDSRDAAVRRKLSETVIPSLDFQGAKLSQALSALSSSSEEHDANDHAARGVNITLENTAGAPDPVVNIALSNMSLGRVLDVLTEQTGRSYEIRDGSVVVLPPDAAKPAPRPAPDAALRREVVSAEQPVSTFSLHVSDASFRLARAALSRGEFPDPAAVRPEEFYNAFDYGDPAPVAGEPVAARVEQAAHPFLQQRNLLRVALRVPAAGRASGQPLRLTLLLDTSGSMEREDRVATVRAALEQLATLLGPADRVTLVGFARAPRLLADRIPGNQAASLAKLAADTPPEGGTNLDAALQLASELAVAQFDPSAQNRVVLLTDGAANLGDADPAALAARVVQLRQKGVAFDACGVGSNGLDDGVLESLTRQGDGRYLLLENASEAGPAFARQLAGAFRPAAQNVKVQVRFNASRVPRYRLVGFEQHRLREEDFRNDKVDAAELAAAEAAVALYQVEVDPQGSGELGEVFVRFRETATGRMIERSWPLPYDASAAAFDRATPSLQLAGASALLAEKLQGGDLGAQVRLAELDPIAAALRSRFADQPRVAEFLDMLAQARRLAPE